MEPVTHSPPAYVIAAVSDLLPSLQQALEEARRPDGWDEQRLGEVVRHEFGFLGPFTKARIERGVRGRAPDEDVLVLEFAPPEGRDVAAAERRFSKAAAHAERGEIAVAQKELERLVHEFPEIGKYRRALGHSHLVAGEPERAEDELLRSLALDPRDPDALTLLGNLYMQSQRPAKAIPLYERSAALQQNVYALANLGAALAQTRRLDEAVLSLRKATQLDPKYPNAWYGLGLALSRLEDPSRLPEAIGALDRALEAAGDRRKAPEVWDTSQSLLGSLSSLEAAEEVRVAEGVIRDVIAEESARGGLPVRVEEGSVPGALAKIELGWPRGRPYHRLLIGPEAGADRAHFERHELEHLRLINLARGAGRNRWLASSAATREHALRALRDDISRLAKRGMPQAQVASFIQSALDGLLQQLYNFPVDFLIERRILEGQPGLRELVYNSVRRQLETAIRIAEDRQIAELTPKVIFRANTAMNGAFALWLEDTFPRRTDFVGRFQRTEPWGLAKQLYHMWKQDAARWSPGAEYDWIDSWASGLRLKEWYFWQPDTDHPQSHP